MCPKTKFQNEEIKLKSRENIVSAALKLFARNGYNDTSVRMIAEEAGVSLGLMYNYFNSKEEMLLSILSNTFKDLDSVFAPSEDESPKEQFKAAIEKFIEMLILHKHKFRMMAQMGLHQNKFDEANKLTQEVYEQSVLKIAQNLTKLGYTHHTKMEARFIVAILDGLTFETLLMDQHIPLLQIKDYIIEKYCS